MNKMIYLNYILCDEAQTAQGAPQGGGMSMIIMLLLKDLLPNTGIFYLMIMIVQL